MKWRLGGLVLGGLALLLVAIYLAGSNPLEAFSTLIRGTFGTPSAIAGTLKETTPLLIAGTAVFLAFEAGLFNIGAEGQLVAGAILAAFVGLRLPGPAGVLLGIVLAMIGGALWALPAGLIKAYRGGHEVIVGIMLNSIAGFLATALVAGPLRDSNQQALTTAMLHDSARLPWLFSNTSIQVSSGLLFGVLVVASVSIWLRKTVAGYELRAVGKNPRAASVAGIDPARVIVRSMTVSGALVGLAGAVQVLGYEGRFFADFSPGYGFTALGVAILAGGRGYGVLFSALLFGSLSKGGSSLQILGIPKGLSFVLLGLAIVLFAAFRYRGRLGQEAAA